MSTNIPAAVVDEVALYAPELLPGAVDEVARRVAAADPVEVNQGPGRIAAAVHAFLESEAGRPFRDPDSEGPSSRSPLKAYLVRLERSGVLGEGQAAKLFGDQAARLAPLDMPNQIAAIRRLVGSREGNAYTAINHRVGPPVDVSRTRALIRTHFGDVPESRRADLAEAFKDVASLPERDAVKMIASRLGIATTARKYGLDDAVDPKDPRRVYGLNADSPSAWSKADGPVATAQF